MQSHDLTAHLSPPGIPERRRSLYDFMANSAGKIIICELGLVCKEVMVLGK